MISSAAMRRKESSCLSRSGRRRFSSPGKRILHLAGEEVRARGGELYVFADGEAGFNGSDNMHIIEMPHVEETIAPIFYTVPLQLLAYHVALIKGTDVDQPRNLAKSVTVE